MINEQYLRAVLLGGMQPTSLLQSIRRFGMLTVSAESSGILSVPELDRLQQRTLGHQLTEGELVQPNRESRSSVRNFYETLVEHYYSLNRSEGTSSDAFESIINDALTRVSHGAQWHSLGSDILSRLESVYVFRDEGRVNLFLEKNAFLAPLLLQANTKIRDYFGASLPIVLDVSLDPENGEYQELWARIQTHLAPADALPILTRFDEEWWLRASVVSRNLLNIKLEYA